MRIAFISDLHSNIYAVESLQKSLRINGVDKVICLGDIVGYGANPNEVCQWVMENVELSLRGNHDTLISSAEDIDIHNPFTLKAAFYNAEILEGKYREFLKTLSKDFEDHRMILTHDDPCIPGSMEYITDEKDARDTFSSFSQRICFYGHTHLPVVFVKDGGEVYRLDQENIKLEKDKQYLINPGSIGQPRDKDPRLSYLIFDTKRDTITFIRQEYDIGKAASDILAAGLPEIFANRLFKGL